VERDIEKQPYSPDEARIAAFFCDRGIGGGDDPIGAILAGYAYLVAERNDALIAISGLNRDWNEMLLQRDALALQVQILSNERDEARALGRLA
jgi:hypothetical protein